MIARRSVVLAVTFSMLLALPLLGCSKDKSTNPTPTPTPKELNSPNLLAGDQFVHTFATAGSFPYHCTFHSPMTSTIVVATGGLDSLSVNIANSTASGFQPQAVGGVTNVKPGGYVHWRNTSGATHTVTSD